MSAAMWRVLVVMAALLAVMLPGCGRQGGDSARSGDVGRSPAPTLEQLSRASYSGIGAAPVRLSDGRFEGPPLVAGAASRQIIELLEEHVAFGDLDGDASDEAAVLLGENSGGSGSHLYLAVVAVRRGSVENLATALLGDRLQVRSLQVADRRVRIDLLEHGPGDPACCPTQPAVQEWLLRDRHVVKAGAGNGAAAGVPTYRGALVWGHESRSFRECGSPREGWVVDATGGRIREVYESLATEPYQPIYVVVRGRWLPGLTSGFAADYRERFEILDLRRAERAEAHAGRHHARLHAAGAAVEQGDGGVEDGRAPAQQLQLLSRAFVAAGLVQALAIELGDLIGPDHQRLRKARGDRAGFLLRQAQRGLRRQLAGPRRLVHVRGGDLERQAQARQELAPVGGSGGENQHRREGAWRARRGPADSILRF